MSALFGLLVISLIGGLPAYVIGQRSRVRDAWVAFIPFVGPCIVLLWSVGRSSWLLLLLLVPLVNICFATWLLFALPSYHRRSLLWGIGLLVPVVGICVYALTLSPQRPKHAVVTERRDWSWI
jgi:hypothetical protein